jgi:hypothetical protein
MLKQVYIYVAQEIAKPLLRRAGTALGVYLAASAVPAENIDQIITGLGAAGLVAIDLLSSHLARKNAK